MKSIGKYTLLGELGRGGTGVVYRALDTVLQREVALKTHTVGLVPDDESIQRFLREARLIALLGHRNIVTLYDIGRHQNGVYIVMELLQGEDLTARLRSRRHLSLEEKVRIVSEVAEGLAHAHRRGVVHRDVKPRNVFLTEQGEVKLLDFGLAHTSQSTLTVTGQLLGTPHYMSPEQVLGRKADPRSDIFSLGSLFYELLTGKKPFAGPTLQGVFEQILDAEPSPIRESAPAVPDELSKIVSKMLRKPVEERYACIEDLLSELTQFRHDLNRRKIDLRDELRKKARQLNEVLGRSPEAKPRQEGQSRTERLVQTADREDLSFMALVGLRDGIQLELRRLGNTGNAAFGATASSSDALRAEEAYDSAQSRVAAGDLAGGLLRVCEALRLSPGHQPAGELAEYLCRSLVAQAECFDREAGEQHVDLLVAALLAMDEAGAEELLRKSAPCTDAETIAHLSELLLAELPPASRKTEPESAPPAPGRKERGE